MKSGCGFYQTTRTSFTYWTLTMRKKNESECLVNRETVLVLDNCKPSIHLSGIPTVRWRNSGPRDKGKTGHKQREKGRGEKAQDSQKHSVFSVPLFVAVP
jgi:hypothetical protein